MISHKENQIVTIALDCMGGDNAPRSVVEGANLIAQKDPNVRFLLYGKSSIVRKYLEQLPELEKVATVYHTDNFITNDEKPSKALRIKDSSMRMAITAVKEEKADAIVSAGNTGALMAISKLVLRPLPSIDRPALVARIPNGKGGMTVFLDMGANIECDSDNLCQFAVMGHAFAKTVLKKEKPTLALLNVGSEDMKGSDSIKTAHQMLKNSVLSDCYLGYVEGDDITKGTADVIITDGFSGNIALKSIEGTVRLIVSMLKNAFTSSIFSKLGYILGKTALRRVFDRMNPKLNNGALFAGLNGIAIKSHGNADGESYANAIKVAISLVREKTNDKIIEEVNMFDFDDEE